MPEITALIPQYDLEAIVQEIAESRSRDNRNPNIP
jgi:hypothetical protein